MISTFTTKIALYSNSVNDVSIDDQTGNYFSPRGLIKLPGDATLQENATAMMSCISDAAFESGKWVTIRGTSAESTVKITTVSGLLVKELQSQGGTTIWDGRDVYGRKVGPGFI
ncbi:MAG: hypothetical protein R3B93_00750 [Bacteroidia bacterium]